MKHERIAAALTAFFLLLLPLRVSAAEEREPIRIAFIDSGVSTRHLDPEHVAEGKNYVFPDSDTLDRIGHGTVTAGLVLGAEDQGVAGVCPEAVAVPLVVMDVYPSGVVKNGGTEALCSAIRDAVDVYRCRIINASLSAAEDAQELRDAVAYAEAQGVLIVSAVGNDGAEGAVCYPAAYPTVVSVGSADGKAPAAFSQRGADLLADGVQLKAATHRASLRPASVSGTSYSCALVTGFCAKLLQAYPDLTPAAARNALYSLADDLGAPGFDEESGWGLLQTDRSLPPAFPDVGTAHWAFPGVFYAASHGIMNGTGGAFEPDATLTRAMTVTILWRMAGAPVVNYAMAFTDVPAGAWYAEAVRWAASQRVAEGYADNTFNPDGTITREQLAVMLFRCAGSTAASVPLEASLEGFSDAGSVSPWALDAVRWAVQSGVLTGVGGDRISPQTPTARAQVATILMRLARTLPANPPEC